MKAPPPRLRNYIASLRPRPIDHPRPAHVPLQLNVWPLGLTPELDRRDEWLDLTYAITSRRYLDQE